MLTLVVAASVWAAPSFELNARAGGQFGGDIQDGETSVSFDSSAAYTFGAGYYVRKDAQAAVWYGLQPTTLRLSEDVAGDSSLDALIHHLMIGGLVEIPTGGIARPFVEAGAGAVIFSVNEQDAGSEVRFAFSVAGGVEIGLTEWLFLRGQVDLRLAFLGGGSLFCGVSSAGGGCLVTVRDVYAQGNASGGIAIKF
jgi:opacity protein-like surface antigen